MFHFWYCNLVNILQIQYATLTIIWIHCTDDKKIIYVINNVELWNIYTILRIETVWYQYDYRKFTLKFEVDDAFERVNSGALRKHK